MTEKPLVSTVICTFSRLEPLVRLIENYRAGVILLGLETEIIISDNSLTGYAREVVERYARGSPPIRYDIPAEYFNCS